MYLIPTSMHFYCIEHMLDFDHDSFVVDNSFNGNIREIWFGVVIKHIRKFAAIVIFLVKICLSICIMERSEKSIDGQRILFCHEKRSSIKRLTVLKTTNGMISCYFNMRCVGGLVLFLLNFSVSPSNNNWNRNGQGKFSTLLFWVSELRCQLTQIPNQTTTQMVRQCVHEVTD